MIDVCLERIRKEADKCSNLQGFVIYSALGGGTGSGLGSELLGRLSAEYSKKTKVGYNIYSSPHTSTTCLEPYNSILSTYARS
jgi:tubulin alpha